MSNDLNLQVILQGGMPREPIKSLIKKDKYLCPKCPHLWFKLIFTVINGPSLSVAYFWKWSVYINAIVALVRASCIRSFSSIVSLFFWRLGYTSTKTVTLTDIFVFNVIVLFLSGAIIFLMNGFCELTVWCYIFITVLVWFVCSNAAWIRPKTF